MAEVNVGDIVWAKMDGFPPWPSVILNGLKEIPKPSKDPNKKYHWVHFFGSKDFAWISSKKVCGYKDNRHKYNTVQKGNIKFFKAVKEADIHIKRKNINPNYKVIVKAKVNLYGHAKKVKRGESRMKNRAKLVNLPVRVTRSVSTPEDDVSQIALNTRDLEISTLVFGVIGIGNIGVDITKNLARSGHVVNIWNRTTEKCLSLVNELDPRLRKKLTVYFSPRALLQKSDVILICVSNEETVRTIFQNSFGINNPLDTSLKNKGIIQMTSTGPEFSKDMKSVIEKKGGRYLEAQIQDSQKETEDGSFVILAAGDETLFFECQSIFKAIGNVAMYLGEVGYACKMNLILQLLRGVKLAALCEVMHLAERSGVDMSPMWDIFSTIGLYSVYFQKKCTLLQQRDFTSVEHSLSNFQKDMKLGLDLSNSEIQPMFMASVANQIYEHCIRLEYGDQDASVIYLRNQH